MASAVEWAVTPAESRLLRLPVYAFVGVVGGLATLVVIGGTFALAHAAIRGNLLPVALVALLALVGGPISARYLWPAIRDPGQRLGLPDGLPRLSRPYAVIAVFAGATAIPASTLISPIGPLVVLAIGFGAPVLVPFLGSTGWAALDESGGGTLSVNGRDVPLAALSGVRSVELGTVVGYWLQYADAPLGAPRWVVVPASVADDLGALLDAGVAAESPTRAPQPLAIRVTLAVFAVGSFAAAGGLWWAGTRYAGSWIVFLPGIAIAALVGGLFGRLAVRR